MTENLIDFQDWDEAFCGKSKIRARNEDEFVKTAKSIC
jgi:hypothetical protein